MSGNRRIAIIDEVGNEQPDAPVGGTASWREDDPSLFIGYWAVSIRLTWSSAGPRRTGSIGLLKTIAESAMR